MSEEILLTWAKNCIKHFIWLYDNKHVMDKIIRGQYIKCIEAMERRLKNE